MIENEDGLLMDFLLHLMKENMLAEFVYETAPREILDNYWKTYQ